MKLHILGIAGTFMGGVAALARELGHEVEGRADDSPESVRTRLKVYDDQTAPVIEYYRSHGQLTVVDGVGSLDEVFSRIVQALVPGQDVG